MLISRGLLSLRAAYDPDHEWTKDPPVYPRASVLAYFILQVVGMAALLLLCVTIRFTRKLHRDKSVYNLFIVLFTACFIDCLTWFVCSNLDSIGKPSYGMCLFQAAFIAGNSTAQGASSIALVFKVWITTVGLQTNRFAWLDTPRVHWGMILLPWISWLAFVFAVIPLGVINPSTIRRDSLYCSSDHPGIVTSHHITSALDAVINIALQIHLAVMVFRYYRAARRARETIARNLPRYPHIPEITVTPLGQDPRLMEVILDDADSDVEMVWKWQQHLSIPFTLRILVFGVYTLALAVIVVYIAAVPSSGQTAMPDLVNATVAPMAFLVFGSQADIIDTWKEWLMLLFSRRPTEDLDERNKERTPSRSPSPPGRRYSVYEYLARWPTGSEHRDSPQVGESRRTTGTTAVGSPTPSGEFGKEKGGYSMDDDKVAPLGRMMSKSFSMTEEELVRAQLPVVLARVISPGTIALPDGTFARRASAPS